MPRVFATHYTLEIWKFPNDGGYDVVIGQFSRASGDNDTFWIPDFLGEGFDQVLCTFGLVTQCAKLLMKNYSA